MNRYEACPASRRAAAAGAAQAATYERIAGDRIIIIDGDTVALPCKAPVQHRDADAMWVEPILVAEIEFRGWTDDGKLRHASFKGLRDEADEESISELGD